jgi:hypothetical protein
LRRLASFKTESVNLRRLHLLDSLHLLDLRPERLFLEAECVLLRLELHSLLL